jgi:hypothetical protein
MIMWAGRAAIRAVLSMCLVAVTASCTGGLFGGSPPELSNDAVVGAWRGSGEGELTFSNDGTFRASHIPAAVFGQPPVSSSAAVSGSGRWTLAEAINDTSGRKTQVSLIFEESDGLEVLPYSVYLWSDRADGEIFLFGS